MQDGILNKSIKYMINSKVASNLLMAIFLLGGFYMFINAKQEFLPDVRLAKIDIQIEKQASTPDEIEKSIVIPVEQAIQGIDGIKQISSSASEDLATVNIELYKSTNKYQAYQDVKSAIDAISTLPDDAKRPVISLSSDKRDVMEIMFYADADDLEVHKFAQEVKNKLLQKPNISLIEIEFEKKRELSIQVQPETLEKYNLSLADIADKINQHSQEIGAGTLYSKNSDILVKIDSKIENYNQIANTPIVVSSSGSVIKLYEIAEIKDGFAEQETELKFNGKPGIVLTIYTLANQTPIGLQKEVFEFLETTKFPDSIGYQILDDEATMFKGRAEILLKNACIGLILILVILGIFLDPRLAFWVMLGLPISILGSFLIINSAGVSINLISMFAFIITLGVIVDDAIIIGENIYEKTLEGLDSKLAAIEGAKEMAPSVIFAVLTNIMAFAPILFVSGEIGEMFKPIPVVMISVLAVSLIESLYILPRHLAKTNTAKPIENTFIKRLNNKRFYFINKLNHFNENKLVEIVEKSIKFRYNVVAIALAILIFAAGLIAFGLVETGESADIEGDSVAVSGEFAYGSAYKNSVNALSIISSSLMQTAQDYKLNPKSINYDSLLGVSYDDDDTSADGVHKFSLRAQLPKQRDFSAIEFAEKWEENTPKITGLASLTFSGQQNYSEPLRVELSHPDKKVLEESANTLIKQLKKLNQVKTLKSSNSSGKLQYSLKLSEKAIKLGLTTHQLSQQVKNAFYGAEAFKQQVKYDEVTYLVKLDHAHRQSIDNLYNLKIRVNNKFISLSELAEIKVEKSYTSIDKTNGSLIIAIIIDVSKSTNEDIFTDILEERYLIPLTKQINGLSFSFEGQADDDDVSFKDLELGFLSASVLIYTLLVLLFNSYSKPFLVVLSIPLAATGAILGHFILQTQFTLESMIGLLALAGIVVNNGLVLLVTINKYKQNNLDTHKALIKGCQRRFRPIVLTSLTTFIGLVPILLETSYEAAFLVPMVISISFGMLYATLITICVLPALYKIFEDLKFIK